MDKKRGFEIAKGFENLGINLPVRKTKYSAGYDVEAAEDIIIPSFKKGIKPVLVKTGLVPSKSEARRAVEQGGVSVDGEKVADIKATFAKDGFAGDGKVVKRGKKNFRKVVM